MKKKDSLEEPDIDYNLKDSNNDNDIEYDYIYIDNNNNYDNINNLKGSSLNISDKKQQLNYSLIINNVKENILNKSKEKFFDDEYKINLLLMSSLNDISIKSLCLNFIFKFNEEKNNHSIIKYVVSKIYKYYEKNGKLNIKNITNILNSFSDILFQKKKYFHAYYFLKKAKTLLFNANNKDKDLQQINLFISDIEEMISKHINSKYQLFKDKTKMNEKKLNAVNNILQEILLPVKKNININDENEEYGSYLFMINANWVIKAKIFLDYYKVSSSEIIEEDSLKNLFNTKNILNSYFNEKDKNICTDILYPGPINNYNLLKYKDAWEDNINDDENYFIKDNLELNKDYYLISHKNWNFLNEIFDSTNEIKMNENNCTFIELKPLILDKRFKKKLNKNLLRRRNIKIRKNIKINKLKEKIMRCINNELKITNLKDENFLGYEDEFEEINNMMKNLNLKFYYIEKKNKNILVEICIAYTNKILIYNSVFLKEIKLNEEDLIDSLLKIFEKKNHILIIEISEKNMDNFLQEIKPVLNTENDLIYQCNICEKEIHNDKKYFCEKCNMSFFCSKSCADISGDHLKLHKSLSPFLKSPFDLKLLLKRDIYIDDCFNKGRVGLKNLGNTCYLNSVIQCLSNTLDLTKYFIYDYYKNEQNCNDFDYQIDIVREFSNLLKKIWLDNDHVVSPRNFIIAFCKLNQQFCGNLEQDAQEFLSALLTNLHNKLNRIITKPDNKQIEEKKENESILEASIRFQKYEKMKNDSIIYDLFNGQLMSSLTCEICGHNSTTFEEFNILSLPIAKNHYLLNIKYFTEKDLKKFPLSINEKTTFGDLKEKALTYIKDDILKKILKNSNGNFNNILNQEKKNIIYNYNNTNIPKYIFYKYIDIIILNKYKMIFTNRIIKDEEKILSVIDKKENEIVLYEKEVISENYINIYITASCFYKNSKLLFFKKSISNYSYPILFSLDKNMSLDRLNEFLKNKFINILDINNTKEFPDNPIQINILHFKKDSPCFFCKKTYEESHFCLLDNLLKKQYTISQLTKGFKDEKIVLSADSKNFSVQKKCIINNILYINPDIEEKNENEVINIYDCLEKFREEEILEKDNKYHCESCKIHQNAKKKIQIYKPPLYLIVQLKRFKYSNSLLSKLIDDIKIETFVYIPETLDLKEYVYGPYKNNSKYELYGNILHIENHYVAICKNDGVWIIYDDKSISKSSFPQNKNSYLLFYKRKN